ncbi:hypothetical protein G5714_020796 [Onychostoma macrolepis]|uniref:Uncharacterized protein n=1 Tax=Onychostoma macrolepis TaxID=369639 RepID=A0A7J6BUU4_9TELE|nr:hypothetical protein G5714_020796 [Onychostoma macrolepis]
MLTLLTMSSNLSAFYLWAVRSHSRKLSLPTPAPSRCPFNLMDVINNGRPLLTPTPGHRKSQASQSGSPSPAEVSPLRLKRQIGRQRACRIPGTIAFCLSLSLSVQMFSLPIQQGQGDSGL